MCEASQLERLRAWRERLVSASLSPIAALLALARLAHGLLQQAARPVLESHAHGDRETHAKLQPEPWAVLPATRLVWAVLSCFASADAGSVSNTEAARTLLACAGHHAMRANCDGEGRGLWRLICGAVAQTVDVFIFGSVLDQRLLLAAWGR